MFGFSLPFLMLRRWDVLSAETSNRSRFELLQNLEFFKFFCPVSLELFFQD